MKTTDIHIRDPFILAEDGTYFLYSQTGNRDENASRGVEVRTSRDLKNWDAPQTVMRAPKGTEAVWAPEVHAHNGAYYLFVTLTFSEILGKPPVDAPDWMPLQKRGVWIFRAASPLGPFLPLRDGPHTPPEWMALDGTPFFEDGVASMAFCHEWVQIVEGTMDLVRLSDDLSAPVGEPAVLFKAGDAPGAIIDPRKGKVTDAPFFYRSPRTGRLFMTWSTFIPGNGYCAFQTQSQSGRVAGPWGAHAPLYTGDGGHGMLFTDFNGRLLLALHQPNNDPLERLHLFEVRETDVGLEIAGEIEP
ncbi:MAG: glycoside hydrolase family 43 protein [Kiritimatiellaeota bacterium]|nr:glycoside hydrolase family 43 protein [Kiritimatiellota bacterium]